MNPIRGIAKRITRAALGVHPLENYPVSDWIVQQPSITSQHFRLSDALVFDNLFLAVVGSRPSTNLLPQIPEVYEASEPFITPEITRCTNIRITVPEVIELTDWLTEAADCSSECIADFTAPATSLEEIASFESPTRIEQEYLPVPLTIAQVSENLFVDSEVPDFKECCFKQNEFTEEVQQYQDNFENLSEKQENKDKTPPQEPKCCKILYPLLLPPLSLEDNNDLDFYNSLRGYQKQGIKFLFENPSALLADEMGTGKTVQAVNALRLLFRQAYIQSALIVCPPAIIGSIDLSIETGNSEGWSGHFYHWAPELQVAVMRGGKKDQRKVDWQKSFHIYITTYETLRADLNDGVLTDLQQFDCIVLDEAQKIKNRETKTAKAIYRLQADYRWALTGTPIENHQNDVMSVFDFIRPTTFLGGIK